MSYDFGEMDERIIFNVVTLSPNGIGGFYTTYGPNILHWAHVRFLSGNEKKAYDKLNPINLIKFIVRYDSVTKALKESDRITWDNKFFNIRSIRKFSNRAMYLEIDAESGVTQ
jgi:head-tail adaptor